MVNYRKFWIYCLDHSITKSYLVDEVGLTWGTVSKLRENEYVKIQVLERICTHFNLKFDDIMEIETRGEE